MTYYSGTYGTALGDNLTALTSTDLSPSLLSFLGGSDGVINIIFIAYNINLY
jgi:hypothetical protein